MSPVDAAILFVTGTDTGVGKTLVAAALVRRLRVLGKRAIGVKPVETGCSYRADGEEKGDLIAPDGNLLHRASALSVPPLVVAPYRFAPPVAPALAAERAGLEITLRDLIDAVKAALRFGDLIVVEGAGGALSPISSDGLALDLAERLGAPVLLIAPDRLGVQSQVLAVLESIRRRALPIAGVMLSRADEDDALLDAQENARMIRERGGASVFPTVPRIAGDDDEKVARVEAHLAEHRIGEALLDAAARP